MRVRYQVAVRTLLLAAFVCGLAVEAADAQSRFGLFGKSKPDSKQREAQRNQSQAANSSRQNGVDMTSQEEAPDGTVILTYYSTPWIRVLERVAKATGSTLIADRTPPGKFSRTDLRKYSRSDAVRILNQELAYHEFKILEKGKYMILVHLPTTRPDYRRPVLAPTQQQARYPVPPRIQPIAGTGYRGNEQTATTIRGNQNSPNQNQRSAFEKSFDGRGQTNLQREPRTFPQGSQFEQNRFQGQSVQRPSTFNNRDSFVDSNRQSTQSPRQTVQNQPRALEPYRQDRRNPQLAQQTHRYSQQRQQYADREPNRLTSDVQSRQAPRPMQRVNRQNNRIQSTGFFDEKSAPQSPATPPKVVVEVYRPTTKKALKLAEILYDAFGERAEAVKGGDNGLPEIRFYSAKPKTADDPPRKLLFRLAVDTKANELLIRGTEEQTKFLTRLLKRMDTITKEGDPTTEIVTTDKKATQIADQVEPAINKAAAKNDGKPVAPPVPDENVETDRKDDEGLVLPDLINQIRSEVSIEAMDELGVLILDGNKSDIEAVVAIINQIEALSARTAPDIHVRMLEHVNSEALAELLTTVYTNLNAARGRTAQQSPPISIIAVGRPNAILVLASPLDLESVNELVDQLDKPINPNTNFMVFPLKHTIASQVQTVLEGFYAERVGLDTRAKIVADVRTNSIVVLARPNDLREIAKLIPEIDKQDSSAVAEVKVYELKHSASTELADTINSILQGSLNPPTLGQGQLGQAFLGFGGGNASQQLRDVRSVVLEYLVGEGEAAYKVRSGILADIRISGDARSNTLVVTSPKESIPLITELVRRLDRPASAVATIKHFTLKKADATSVTTLLNDLFTNQTTAGNTQVGVQLAGAEDASSIVPLRFSTDVRTNSIVAVGTEEALGVVEALIFRLDATDIRNRQTTIVRLKNSPAQNIADAVNAFLQSQTDLLQSQQELVSAFEVVEREVIIQAEPFTNSLLISATPQYFDQIRDIVIKLDEEQAQVVIQVMLVEVTLDNTDEFGVELGFQDPVLFDRSLTAAGDLVTLAETATSPNGVQTTTQRIISQTATPGFPFNTPTLGNNIAANPARVGTQGLSNFGVGRVNNDLGFGGLVVSAGSDTVNVLLRALSSKRNVEVLSRPQVRTLDNQPALIRVGQEVPRISGFTTTGLGANVPVVEPAEAGIILQVTPTISPDGNIRVTITAEKSQFDPNNGVILISDPVNGNITSPVKDITQAETTVVVQDEQTIVLGGLITKSKDTLQRKVPWLSDIPFIGEAFQFKSETSRRTELLMFLTPRVVKGNAYNEMLKQIESDRMHYTESEAEEVHGPIFGLPAETMNDSTGYPMSPGRGLQPIEPLPLPAAEENGVPMTVMPPRSQNRNVNFSNAQALRGSTNRGVSSANRGASRQTSRTPSRFANGSNSIQQANFVQPTGSSRVQVSSPTMAAPRNSEPSLNSDRSSPQRFGNRNSAASPGSTSPGSNSGRARFSSPRTYQ